MELTATSAAEAALARLAGRATQLYSLPAVAMKVLELTGNPHVDTHALKKCIENDPALTAKILRVVNSSLFGLSREVSDLNQALALLGIKPLKMLVLGFSLPQGLFSQVEGNVLDRYWRHALTKAVAGREISESLWRVPGDDAFIAGLLQDLGQLLLIQEIGAPYLRLLQKVDEGHLNMASVEIETMGFDHTELTSRILAGWGLPAALVESVPWGGKAEPDGEPTGPGGPLRHVLHLAELLAGFLADGRPEALAELLIVGRRYRELSEGQLEQLVNSLEEKVRHLADVFSLNLPDGLNYNDVLLRAYRQLAALAESSAVEAIAGGRDASEAACEEQLLGELADLTQAVTRIAAPAPLVTQPAPRPTVATVATTAAGSERVPGSQSADAGNTEADLLERLTVAARLCRDLRCPLSLILLKLQPPAAENFSLGTAGYDVLLRELEQVCRRLDHPSAVCCPNGPGGFAIILQDCERQEAVQYGNQLTAELRRWVRDAHWAGRAPEVIVSVGAATVAIPPRNFWPEGLLDAASRCVYASRSSGGVVKSIEMY